MKEMITGAVVVVGFLAIGFVASFGMDAYKCHSKWSNLFQEKAISYDPINGCQITLMEMGTQKITVPDTAIQIRVM